MTERQKQVLEVLAHAVSPAVLDDKQARIVAEVCVERLEAAGWVVVPKEPEGYPCLRDDLHDYLLDRAEGRAK